jgi:RNA polymerase sigma-70 factor, ECF subfamily
VGQPRGVAAGVEQPRRRFDRPEREDEQMGAPRRATQQMQDQLHGRVVGPVQVVEHEHHRLLATEELQQAPQGAVIAKALGRAGLAARLRRGVGGRGGQHGPEIGPERRHPSRVHRRDVVVERIDHHAERNVALVLGAARGEHEHAMVAGRVANGTQERALADTGLAEYPQGDARALVRVRHGLRGGGELLLAPDQLHARSLGASEAFLGPTRGSIPWFPGLAGGPFRSNVYGVPKKTEIDLTTAPYVREAPAPPAAPAPAPLRDVPRRLDPDCAADHLNRLYRLAVGLSRSSVLAEDLVQETYARVLARPRLVSGDEFSYLARALRNVLINHLRSESRRGEVPAPEQLDLPDPRPTADPHTAAQTRELYRTIAGLPDDQRHVIAAVDLAGMTYADAAELLDVPPGTVMSRLYRARERVALDLEL